jgi:hypothetical protein
MDKVVQKELIKKLYTNPLRKREKERRIKEMGSLEKEEPKEKVLFRTTQPILTNMNTYDYIDKLFNDNVNNSNIDNLLTDLEKIHVNTIKNQQTRKRKRNNNQENQENPIKKIKLELEKIQDEIKGLEYIFHMGKSTPPTKKELKEKNVLRRKKEFAKTYKITNHNISPVKIVYKPMSKGAITRKINKLKEQEEALKLIIEKRLRSGKL